MPPDPTDTTKAIYDLQLRVAWLEQYNSNLLRLIQTNFAAIMRTNPYPIERSSVPLNLEGLVQLGQPAPTGGGGGEG